MPSTLALIPAARPRSVRAAAERPVLRFNAPLEKLRAALLAWYQQTKRPLPWRQLWTERGDPYTIWVSEIMLQQTVIKAVIPVYARFLARFPTLHDLAAATEDEVREAVRGLGYYRRFRFLHLAAKQLTASGGQWPTTFAGWKELPGVGDYTAAAISSIGFGAPAAVVDGNVERVFCRLLDLREAPNQPQLKRSFQELATAFLDRTAPGDFNQAVMELGQTLCTPSSPRCGECPLAAGCLARERGSQALAPAAKVKTAVTLDIAMELLIMTLAPAPAPDQLPSEPAGEDLVVLLPRPDGARFLAGTTGFLTSWTAATRGFAAAPTAPVFDGWPLDVWGDLAPLSPPTAGAVEVGSVRHGITHHRIKAAVWTELLKGEQAARLPPGARLVPAAKVEAQLVANLDRKAWQLFLASRQEAPGSLFAPAGS